MDSKKNILTSAGLKEKEERLDYLKNVKLLEVAEKIKVALSFGDLSENSEYDEAKNEQGKIAQRIAELEALIANAQVIDESQIDSSVVGVGSTVEVFNQDKKVSKIYHIVGSFEADPFSGKISDVSPIGAALMGSRVGDVVEAVLPSGSVMHLEVKKVDR